MRGLSLVEVLVVLGIIALLAGLLWPVLARARDAGRQAVCASRLQMLYAAAMCYAADYSGYLPLVNFDFPGGHGEWLLQFAAGDGWKYIPFRVPSPPEYYTIRVALAGYVEGNDVWFCPNIPPRPGHEKTDFSHRYDEMLSDLRIDEIRQDPDWLPIFSDFPGRHWGHKAMRVYLSGKIRLSDWVAFSFLRIPIRGLASELYASDASYHREWTPKIQRFMQRWKGYPYPPPEPPY